MSGYDTGAGHGFLRLTSWRFRVGLGAAVFATIMMLALLSEVQPANGAADPSFVLGVSLALGVDVWIVLAILSGKGRRIALGFLCGIVGMAMVRPAVARVWGLPATAVLQATRPAWAPLAAAGAQSEQRTAWARARSGDAPAIIHAQRLINFVHECAARYRAADSLGSYPRSATDLARIANCGELAETRLGNDSARTLYDSRDYGWRWSYAPSTSDSAARMTGYSIEVRDDPMLQRASPRYTGDETGRVWETEPGKSPRIVTSPVRDLAQLRRCLQRVPAENERHAAEYPAAGRLDPLSLVNYVCPELKGHYYTAYPDREYGTIALSARNTAGEFVDTVAVYTIEYIPADVEGLIFELQARPRGTRNPYIHSGSRRFFVARDGSIHVGTGPGPATISDPLAEECLAEPDLCSDRPPEVRQAPGS
ncbi:MAG: hypothetical protein HOQ11_11465 [Gemmatimonadaceae bacterium]|nr:hypothetical protein [Gemmatimonadaceae bacterium]NUQ93929.1 hypothetical protein [Gemmatimonadaceae bacterium]NUR19648.1 hypothetical protein [Gemmatimonadaceae bacterium]NUS98012.1 hypothetical protein [Gemmatimonadaceae bacterium]